MNHVEHYHDWLRDAHAMEKQAESMLESMAGRIDNYPDLRARIEQHINETKRANYRAGRDPRPQRHFALGD